MKFLIILLASSVSSAPTSEGTCCKEKTVGKILYYLLESDKDDMTKKFGCKNGCVYNADQDPVTRFCFKDGHLPVHCHVHWGYEGDIGPAHWGKDYPDCNGRSQSPIDINITGDPWQAEPTPLTFGNYDQVRLKTVSNSEEHYGTEGSKGKRIAKGNVLNNGHTAELEVIDTLPGGVGILSGGPLTGKYQIKQLHFHWGSDNAKGSEHTLGGKRFPMEMHIVHKKLGVEDPVKVKGGFAVTGFFFEVGTENNHAIEPLVSVLKNIIDPNTNFNMSGSTFKINELISGVAPLSPNDPTEYSNYNGSLTTPGCYEIVNWINFIKPINISSNQLELFRALKNKENQALENNFRPTQPLNGRTVTFYNK